MEFSDRVLKCIDCGAEFVFTAGEQLFFYDKQFKNDPKHCKQCKAKRASGSRVRTETRTSCSQCGEETTVPFKPTQGRPVLCRSCFQKQLGQPKPAPDPKSPVIKSPVINAPEINAPEIKAGETETPHTKTPDQEASAIATDPEAIAEPR